MCKLEDLLAKKKTVIPVLDLSKNLPQTKDEFKRLMEKVPDYKMRPVRVRGEEIKIKEKDYTFKPSKKEQRKLLKQNGERDPFYTYPDPVPNEMRGIVLTDLCTVPIDWKMLTILRPRTKIEEEYFSRLVEMGKLQLKTVARDKKECQTNPGIRKVKNKTGIVETRLISCPECGEELCNGRTCLDFNYDLYVRVEVKPPQPHPTQATKSPMKATNHKGSGSWNKKKPSSSTSKKRKNNKRNENRSSPKK